MIRKILVLALLSLCAAEDLRKMEIYMPPVYLGLAIGLGMAVMGEPENFLWLLAGSIPGGLLLLLSWLSREAIGQADAILFLVLGFFMGLGEVLLLLMLSLLLAALIGLLLWIRRKSMRLAFPFVPCILWAYVLMLAGEMIV